MTTTLQRRLGLGISALAAAVLAACSTTPTPNAQLEQARSLVNRTAADPNVNRLAAVELQSAQSVLARGEAEFRGNNRTAEVNHLAYLASQQAEIASAVARSRAADEALKTGNETATQLRLQARTAEADRAQQQAQAAQQQASAAQQQVNVARQQANEAQAQAQAAKAQAANAKAQLADMAQRLNDIEAKQTDRGLLVTLGDLLFETGRSQLLPGANARLDKLAHFLTQYPDRQVLVEGHTDSTGSRALNESLSKQRADAVKAALVSRGIAGHRITTAGFAFDYPVASNDNAEGRAQNRRVEMVIADDKGVMRARR